MSIKNVLNILANRIEDVKKAVEADKVTLKTIEAQKESERDYTTYRKVERRVFWNLGYECAMNQCIDLLNGAEIVTNE